MLVGKYDAEEAWAKLKVAVDEYCCSTEVGGGSSLEKSQDARELLEAFTRLKEDFLELQEHCKKIDLEIKERNESLRKIEAFAREQELAYNSVIKSRSWMLLAPLRKIAGLRHSVRFRRLVKSTLLMLPGGPRLVRYLSFRTSCVADLPGEADVEPIDILAAKAAFKAKMQAQLDAFLAGKEDLVLPSAKTPRVSVLLVLWNQAELTFACLLALAGEREVPIEIVIVDNGSTDRTKALLARVRGATVIRNAANVGFLRAVNLGAASAKGDYLLLLNNDAVLRPGSLAAAVETLSDASIGAVGGRIVLLNGLLQEAGDIVWNDGSCLGYARERSPKCGEVMFRRDVDYCSGAFLMFSRALFNEMGGLDDEYAPAYYEETDFCLRLWERGLRVVFEPRIVIDHFEFGSAGSSEWAIKQQTRNRGIFQKKHGGFLAGQFAPAPETILSARMRGGFSGRVLVVDDRVPLRTLGAGFPRARDLIFALHADNKFVTLYPLRFPSVQWTEVWAELPAGVEVMADLGMEGLAGFLAERKGYYDTIIVSRPHNMEVVQYLLDSDPGLLGGALLVYDAEAVAAVREIHEARTKGSPMSIGRAERLIAHELSLARSADRVVTVNESEADRFREAGYPDVRVLGHAMQIKATPRPFSERSGLLFIGSLDSDDSPNVDSLLWFADDILPLIRQRLGQDVVVTVAGRNGAKSLKRLTGKGLIFLGEVDELTDIYDRGRVFIAPTRFAGGIPHKIHGAVAHGVPTVATSLLVDQLQWQSGRDILGPETAEQFAAACVELLSDAELWMRLRENGLQRVHEDCSPELFMRTVRDILVR